MSKPNHVPDWKPRLRGAIYCSPACGGRCTRQAYLQAVRNAATLVVTLKGDGWEPVVIENQGWHYRAISGPIQVYPSPATGKFWCMIGSEPKDNAGGSGLWTPDKIRHFKDPNRAVRDALRHVRSAMASLNETLHAAEQAAGVKPAPNGNSNER